MLLEIRGSDKKCTDMMADYVQYHRVSMNSYLTRRVHSQMKACPSTHTSPGNDVMTQLMPYQDEHLHRNCVIFFVTILRNALRKSLETHGVDNVKPYRSTVLR